MIKYSNIYKSFKKNSVLENINITIPSSEITALVGKNGSGKTTLMRLTASLLSPDKGKIDYKGSIGILLGGSINLYGNLSVEENIDFFARLHKLSKYEFENNLSEINKFIQIDDFMNKKFNQISRGMQQKTALVISIIHNPDILLLDEPSTGLDLMATKDVFNFVKMLKDKEKTILISTHNISEIADLSDNIAILKNKTISKIEKREIFFENCEKQEQLNKICNYLEK
ncbi:MAG: ATP-binding cassette domain-containing protein [Clostridia bacterium]|nr:ATP-binding cassette domain-containing protein [Clostridia bacterium]